MKWDIEGTDQFAEWYDSLTEDEMDAVNDVVDLLEEEGPALRRPAVGIIKGSRHPNMKELIPGVGNLRILFAFDPRRTAVLLIGGDKSGEWNTWYAQMVPMADDLFDEYLAELRKEGLL